jgi:hypothetical protein
VVGGRWRYGESWYGETVIEMVEIETETEKGES